MSGSKGVLLRVGEEGWYANGIVIKIKIAHTRPFPYGPSRQSAASRMTSVTVSAVLCCVTGYRGHLGKLGRCNKPAKEEQAVAKAEEVDEPCKYT